MEPVAKSVRRFEQGESSRQPHSPRERRVQFDDREPVAKNVRRFEQGESSGQGLRDSNLFLRNNYWNQPKNEHARRGYEETRRFYENKSGGKITVKQTPQFSTKPYIPPFSNPIIQEGQWYTKTGGKIVPMTASQRRRSQRQYGEAKKAMKAVQLGHIKPNQLAKSFNQLEDEVRRLSARTFAEVPRQNRGGILLQYLRHQESRKNIKKGRMFQEGTCSSKKRLLPRKKERKFFL
jgi:hypothetical protein